MFVVPVDREGNVDWNRKAEISSLQEFADQQNQAARLLNDQGFGWFWVAKGAVERTDAAGVLIETYRVCTADNRLVTPSGAESQNRKYLGRLEHAMLETGKPFVMILPGGTIFEFETATEMKAFMEDETERLPHLAMAKLYRFEADRWVLIDPEFPVPRN